MLAALRQRSEWHDNLLRAACMKKELAGRRWNGDPWAAAVVVQATWRGALARAFVKIKRMRQRFAVPVIQSCWRRSRLRKKMAKMAKKIQRASLQRIARREAKGIFDAAKNHASWRKYAARQDVQTQCATEVQRWVRRKRARAAADAAKQRAAADAATQQAQARCVADMHEGGFPPDAHEKAMKIQSLARRRQAMSRVEARRSAIRDVADWRREREEKAARCLEHERQMVESKIAAAQLKDLKREALKDLTTYVPADLPPKVERKYGGGGRVFKFVSNAVGPPVNLGSPRIGLLPEPSDNDNDQLDDPIQPPLDEHDGCICTIWTWLHAKHPVTGEGCRNVRLPDTIVYKYRQPQSWYFTDRAGKLRRKARDKITSEQIYQTFTRSGSKRAAPSDDTIVALYTYSCPVDAAKPRGDQRKGARQTVVEHLTAAELRDFIMHRDVVNDGQLQRYVAPHRASNSTFVAVWSPHTLLLERWDGIEVGPEAQARSSTYARTVTHEAEPFSAFCKPIRGDRYPTSVHRTCRSIVEHTASVSLHRICIKRLSLTFKIDEDGELWLSTCTSLRYASSVGGPTARRPPVVEGIQEPGESSDSDAMRLASSLAEGVALRPPDMPQRPRPQSASSSPGRQQRAPSMAGASSPGRTNSKPTLLSRPQCAGSLRTTSASSHRSQGVGTTSGKLGSHTPLDLHHRIRPAPLINTQLHARWVNPSTIVEEGARCIACGRAHIVGETAKLSYRVLIGSHLRENGSFVGRIPPLIASRHPQMSFHQFEQLARSRDAGFLARTISVCHPCWVAFVARGAPSLHSDGAPRTASLATLQQQQHEQRAKNIAERAVMRLMSFSKSAPALRAPTNHREAPQQSAPTLVSNEVPTDRRRPPPKSWAARDLMYLVGHANRSKDRRQGEFIVPQISPWAAREIAERGTGRSGGLSESKVLELFDRMDEVTKLTGSGGTGDLKDLLAILKP